MGISMQVIYQIVQRQNNKYIQMDLANSCSYVCICNVSFDCIIIS